MFGSDDSCCDFMMDFLSVIDSRGHTENRIEKSLELVCNFFCFDRGFIYQTDGFRYFYLKETFGNAENLEPHIEIEGMDKISSGKESNTNRSFFRDSDYIFDIYDNDSKLIGFIGFGVKSGSELPGDQQMKMIKVFTSLISKEISIREYIERGVRIEKTLESIMNNMGVDIYVNSFDSHEMLYANESMAAPYGGKDAFKNKKCWQALYKDKTGECDFCPKWNLIDGDGVPSKVYSWDYRRAFDGSWFRVFSAAFDWIDGQLAHVITSVDITHQKTIEAQLEEAKRRAEELDSLKSTFLANMSHEIRTPLNAIVGFSDLLVYEEDLESRELYMRLIRENNDLLLQLISDILDISKIESGILEFEYSQVDLFALCEDIAQTYIVKEKMVPIIFNTSEPRLTIRTDRKRLTQIITNFINNAIKYTSQGEITISYTRLEDNTIEISVTDTGSGIEPDKAEKVFDRFVQLDNYVKGTGLGLAISKLIIETLKGKIGVSSKVGVGSKFWITHPYNE